MKANRIFQNLRTKTLLILLLSSVLGVALQSILFVQATTIFSDGFESGNFSAWTGTSGSPTVQGTTKHHGNYAMKITSTKYAYKNLASSYSEAYARVYVYFDSLPEYDYYFLEIIHLGSSSQWSYCTSVDVYRNPADHKCYFRIGDGASGNALTSITPATGKWYCVELKRRTGSGQSSVYIDGTLAASVDYGYYGANRVRVGGDNTLGNVAYFDCVVVADRYIGIEGVPVTLQSVEDNELTESIGTITLGSTNHAVPDTFNVQPGTYGLEYFPSSSSFSLKNWVVTGGVEVADQAGNPTSVTVNGEGTITAVYKCDLVASAFRISIDSTQHATYGLGYPVTYKFRISLNSFNLRAYYRFSEGETWTQFEEKNISDFFNGIRCVRFDYSSCIAYVSIGFDEDSDHIYVDMKDGNGNLVGIAYMGMAEYYDNRKAVVTATADDWDKEFEPYCVDACNTFRSYSTWVTLGLITHGYWGDPPGPPTWGTVQTQINNGYVEVASHSATHHTLPYANYDLEIGTSRNEITGNLMLPSPWKKGSTEYVWAWLEPWGTSDSSQRQKCGYYRYLIDRSYYEQDIYSWATWDSTNGLFNRIGISIEMGDASGSMEHDVAVLNAHFDYAYANGGIYHLMCHPINVDWIEGSYAHQHLSHISSRKDVWYVGFGALYAYRYVTSVANVSVIQQNPQTYSLTINVVGNGIVNKVPDQAMYGYGTVVELTAVPALGWSFAGWSGDLGGNQSPANVVIDSNKIVTATFTQNEYTLTVATIGSGSVIKVPDQASYHYGDNVQLTATSALGWSFSSWSGDLTGSNNPETLTMSGDRFVTATFTQDRYTLTVNVVGGGSVIKYPDQATYDYGTSVQLTAIPALGWSFTDWSGDLLGSTNPTTIVMDKSKTVTAIFTENQYTLTVNTAGVGSVSKIPDQATYVYGTSVELTATASLGWSFSQWTGDLTGSVNPVTITITGNMVITATFTQDQYTLSLTIAGDGTVTRSPDLPTYNYGSVVTLTATPNTGWSFQSWSGNLSGSANPATITMTSDKSVTALFTQNQYTLTINIVGQGSVDKEPDQATYTYGTTVQLTATPALGWSFNGWSGDIAGYTNPETITLTGNKAVTATFTQDQYTLNINIVGSGSVNKNPDQGTYTYGTSVQLTASPETGWAFSYWSGDLSGSTSPKTIIITSSMLITAHFSQNQYILTINIVGSGSVDKVPDQATYDHGASVTLIAVANAGWSFNGWSGDLSSSNNPATISIDGDKSITATFTQDHYTLTVTTAGSGSVFKNPDQVTYVYGEAVILTADPALGWSFSSWSGDVFGSTNPATITMTSDKSVTALFTQNQYTLTFNVVGSGSVTKMPDQATYTYGTSVQLTATAEAGWTFAGWSGDLSGSQSPVDLVMDDNKIVTVTFTQNEYTLDVSIVGSGSVTKTPDQLTFHYNDVVELTAVPNAGWSFSGWSGGLVGNPTSVTITGDLSVIATFAEVEYSLTVNISPVDGGSVSKNPDSPHYHYNDVVQLTAIPALGYSFAGWSDGLTGNPTSVTMTENTVVTATFTQLQYMLTINVAGSGSVTQSPDPPYTYGTEATLTAIPATGWSFIGWSGDVSSSVNPVTIIMIGNKAVTATFTQIEYSLTVYGSPTEGGSVTKSPDYPHYHYNDVVQLTADASPGWSFTGWSAGFSGNPTSVTITSHTTVTAYFTQNEYALAVIASPTEGGSVAKNPNLATYHYNEVVELTATAAVGYSFASWSGGLTGNPTSVTITGNTTVTAYFTLIEYTLDVTTVGSGSVSKSPDQPTYHLNDIVELTAAADPGWSFSGWSGDLAGTTNPTSITIDGNVAVTATFTQNTYTIVAFVEGVGGIIAPSGSIVVNGGENITFTITPDIGYRTLNVMVDGTYMGPQSSFTFYEVDRDHNITAFFAKNEYTLTIIIVGPGRVSTNPNKISYSYGDIVELTAIPNNKKYQFAYWSGDLTGNTNPATIIMDGNKTVTATFTRIQK